MNPDKSVHIKQPDFVRTFKLIRCLGARFKQTKSADNILAEVWAGSVHVSATL